MKNLKIAFGELKNSACFLAFSIVLVSCSDSFNSQRSAEANASMPTLISPPPPVSGLIQSRMIDRSVLFAEVILRYEGSEQTAVVSRQEGTDSWQADFRLPSGRDYSIEITWFDTADGVRLNLVNVSRSFNAVFESGPLSIPFSDYDSEDYDEDNDGLTNLAERQAGSSPFEAADGQIVDDAQCPMLPETMANPENRNPVTGEEGRDYLHMVRDIDRFDDALPSINVLLQNLGAQSDGLTAEPDGSLKLSVTSPGDFSSIQLRPIDQNSDFIRATLSYIGEESTQPFVNSENRAFDSRLVLAGEFFNNISDFGNGTREGNGRLSLNLRNYTPQSFSRVLLCAQLIQANNAPTDFVEGTEDGDNDGCSANDTFGDDYNNNQQYRLGIGIDRQARSVFFQRDDNTVRMPTTEPFFREFGEFLALQTQARGLNSKATIVVNQLSTQESVIDDLASLATRPAYNNLGEYRSDANRDRQVENGRLRLTTISEGNNETVNTQLRLSGSSDYLAADLMLSSESRVLESTTPNPGGIQLQGGFYNDLSNNGSENNGSEGDHVGTLSIVANSDGEVFGQACLTRSQSANFDQTCERLTESLSNCQRFPSPLSFDATYSTSIELDRTEKIIRFSIDGQSIEHQITTNVFLPGFGGKYVETTVSGTGTIIGFVDNLSTIK